MFIFVSSSAQNDQVLIAVPKYETMLDIIAANITDENLPLIIQTTQNVNYSEITHIDITDFKNESLPLFIESLHPAIIETFYNLQKVLLSSCKMKKITQKSFQNCAKIEFLFIHNNLLEEIPAGVFRNCATITSLSIVRNQIRTITSESFEGLHNLISLSLDQNQLTSINSGIFSNLKKLSSLFLSFNPIEELQQESMPQQLQWLFINYCNISRLHPEVFRNFTKLSYLNLRSNPITYLSPEIFTDLKDLWIIDLINTKIRRLSSNLFGRLEKLDEFLISNELDEIQPGFFDNFPNLKTFYARENLCVNATLTNTSLINFDEVRVLNQCFANWYMPRTTTEAPIEDNGITIFGSWILITNALFTGLICQNIL